MAKKLYEEASVQAIANAIRAKNGEATTYKIGEMATAIAAISGSPIVDENLEKHRPVPPDESLGGGISGRCGLHRKRR